MSRKRELELERIAMADKVFKTNNKEKKKRKRNRQDKRKNFTDMMNTLQGLLRPKKFVREPAEWKSKSYNHEKQIIDFVKWIYCLYDAPIFMFEIFTKPRVRGQLVSDKIVNHLNWFLVIAGGQSFQKYIKGFLTKKEAHWFLNAPNNNTIKENLWWAKCRAEGLDESLSQGLVKRFLREVEFSDEGFWFDLIKLIKREERKANISILSDVMDFLRDRQRNQPNFSLKGRTLGSLIKLSNQWHRAMQMRRFGDANLTWKGIEIDDWHWHDKDQKITWFVTQLKSSKELWYEGRKMHHCVASYGHRCYDGLSAIFTMTSSDNINAPDKHLTIEINKNKGLVQAKGKMNRHPSGMVLMVLNKWMRANNIKDQHSRYYF